MQRDGPGLLLRDILNEDDPQIIAIREVVSAIDADILVLQGIDYDYDLVALKALRDFISDSGPIYPHLFANSPNSGLQTGLDLDGNGRMNEARDGQGYGKFFGQGAMAILSRYPIDEERVRDFSTMLWRDVPGARLPVVDDVPFPSEDAQAIQRLYGLGDPGRGLHDDRIANLDSGRKHKRLDLHHRRAGRHR